MVSPASGVVLDVSAAPGEFSKSLESANPLITVADLNTVWVVGDVYEKDVAKVGQGKQVTVTLQAYPGQQWTGHIDSLSGALDPTTRTLKVRVALPNPDQRLKPDQSARAAAQYLHYLHSHFKDWRLALAAYNAGEGTVDKLLRHRKTRTFDAIATRLPAETQMYVPRVEATLLRREGVTIQDL